MENIYSTDRFEQELNEWRERLLKVVRTTGNTNFQNLKNNVFFQSLFPKVTSSDEMVINRLLAEIKRLRK